MVPPTIVNPIGVRVSCPSEFPKIKGKAATTVAQDVIRIGRRRTGHPSSKASKTVTSRLSRRTWLVNSTKRIEFFFAIPINTIKPIKLNRFNDAPKIHNARRAPVTLNGKAINTDTG